MDSVIINVGGCKHILRLVDMKRSPRSRLGHLAEQIEASEDVLDLCDDVTFDSTENKMEYFFDRHPVTSANIMNFYRTGKLHCLEEICVQSFSDDLDYWGIEECQLEPCCQFHYTRIKELSTEEIRKEDKCLKLYAKEEDFSNSVRCVKWRKKNLGNHGEASDIDHCQGNCFDLSRVHHPVNHLLDPEHNAIPEGEELQRNNHWGQ